MSRYLRVGSFVSNLLPENDALDGDLNGQSADGLQQLAFVQRYAMVEMGIDAPDLPSGNLTEYHLQLCKLQALKACVFSKLNMVNSHSSVFKLIMSIGNLCKAKSFF